MIVEMGTTARWYADPLSPLEAEQLYERASTRLRCCLRGRCGCFTAQMLQKIAIFWLEERLTQLHIADHPHKHALITLIDGQLLMSRQLQGASEQLERGFQLAMPFLRAGDYFVLVEQHRLLRLIPLHQQPQPPQSLTSLLTMAAVINRLQPQSDIRARYKEGGLHNPDDIYG